MIRRLSAVAIACVLAALTSAAPAYAAHGSGGGHVQTDGNIYCC